jgi:hypothetical protein
MNLPDLYGIDGPIRGIEGEKGAEDIFSPSHRSSGTGYEIYSVALVTISENEAMNQVYAAPNT